MLLCLLLYYYFICTTTYSLTLFALLLYFYYTFTTDGREKMRDLAALSMRSTLIELAEQLRVTRKTRGALEETGMLHFTFLCYIFLLHFLCYIITFVLLLLLLLFLLLQ
jgi:hypothetical protein